MQWFPPNRAPFARGWLQGFVEGWVDNETFTDNRPPTAFVRLLSAADRTEQNDDTICGGQSVSNVASVYTLIPGLADKNHHPPF